MSKYKNHLGPTLLRRHFLTGSLTAGATAAVSWRAAPVEAAVSDVGPTGLIFVSPPIEPFVDDLFVLPRQAAGGLLVAHRASHRFHRDLSLSDTLAFGAQSYLGPVLEAQSEEPVTQTFRNEIGHHPLAVHIDPTLHGVSELDRNDPRMTIHLHGGLTEPGSDGHPIASVRYGQERTHNYGGKQPAMGLWYHDHALGITRLSVYAGLAGHYLIRDTWDTGRDDNPVGLPAGDYELMLVLQDKIFTNDGALGYRLVTYVEEGRWSGGQVGDVPTVNGVAYPRHVVARALYRLRVVNASNGRTYMLTFSNGMKFWLIGNDAGLLNAPVALEEVRIIAGARLDLLVDFSNLEPGARVELRNTEPMPPLFVLSMGDVPIDDIMQFRVASALGPRRGVPSVLRGAPGLPPLLPSAGPPGRVRTMTVLQIADFSRFPPAMMSLNNLRFDTDDVEIVRPGDVEYWDIINVTTDAHPIHLHMALMQVLWRQPYDALSYLLTQPLPAIGQRWAPSANAFFNGPPLEPEPWDAGWHDTVEVPPGYVTRLLVRWPAEAELGFDPDATFPVPDRVEAGAPTMLEDGATDPNALMPMRLGTQVQPEADRARGYVWHCHILDHEDHDMMLPFRLVAG